MQVSKPPSHTELVKWEYYNSDYRGLWYEHTNAMLALLTERDADEGPRFFPKLEKLEMHVSMKPEGIHLLLDALELRQAARSRDSRKKESVSLPCRVTLVDCAMDFLEADVPLLDVEGVCYDELIRLPLIYGLPVRTAFELMNISVIGEDEVD